MTVLKGGRLHYQWGQLEIPTLAELRTQIEAFPTSTTELNLQVSEVIGDVQLFHLIAENQGAIFQAASQFNLLEMVGPSVTPEVGGGQYEYDKTQGPACAIACGAGTIFRNYFVQLGDSLGQTADQQVDCLDQLAVYFANEQYGHWTMRNGYAFVSEEGLRFISQRIKGLTSQEYEQLKGLLRVGIQWNTEVTISPLRHLVHQVYCSGLPVNYSPVESALWEDFARLVLEATYEATFQAAWINFQKTGNNKVYMTLVGGGVFGNKSEWIIDSILVNLHKFTHLPLDVKFISYGQSNAMVRTIIERFQQ